MADSLRPTDHHVCLGAFAGAHGVGGLVRVKSFTEQSAAVGDYGPVATEDGVRAFDLSVVRVGPKDQVIARVKGVDDRAAAEALKGIRFGVDRARLPPPADADEFYHADLVGLPVFGLDGRPLGQVRAVLDYGAGDLLDIGGGEFDLVVPFKKSSVPEVDLEAGLVVVDPPAGLMP